MSKSDSEPFIPYGRQQIDDDDVEAVVEVLRSPFLTQGPAVSAFEQSVAEYTGARYAVAVSSATAGLHIATRALDVPYGCEGITSPITFVASSNALIYNDLTPRFAEIDPISYNMSADALKNAVTEKTKVVIPVHFAGQPADMSRISSFCRQRDVAIIEDAAHAIGGRYADGSRIGSCHYSDMTVFSFHPVKTMTTGEGGIVTTNDEQMYRRLLLLRTHGITKNPDDLLRTPGPWYYEMQTLGYHYRMTDIQAALGSSQLRKLDRFVERRRELVAKYNRDFADVPWIQTPTERSGVYSGFHLYVVKIDFEHIGISRKKFMEALKSRGIGTQVHYIPVHMQPYYQQRFGFSVGDFPVAEEYYAKALSLPLFPRMTDDDQQRVVRNVLAVNEQKS